jgi:protein gp37
MGENSAIEWCDHTFNPWIGCTKVSAECVTCYAEEESLRRGWAEWGSGKPRHVTSTEYWKAPLKWNRVAQITGERPRIFCASLADVFDDDDPQVDRLRERLFELISMTPYLDWLLLSKRPENFASMLPWLKCYPGSLLYGRNSSPWPHVQLGVSVGVKATKWRIDLLRETPAAVRFISHEPLLEDLGDLNLEGIHQGIVGGESKRVERHKSRPMHPDWARALRFQYNSQGIPFFFKQWGDWSAAYNPEAYAITLSAHETSARPFGSARIWSTVEAATEQRLKTEDALQHLGKAVGNGNPVVMTRCPGLDDDSRVWLYCIGKRRAGRELDGRTWDETPALRGHGANARPTNPSESEPKS